MTSNAIIPTIAIVVAHLSTYLEAVQAHVMRMMTVTDEHECDFPDTCTVCNPRVRRPVDTIDYSFVAKFTTECRRCDGAIFDGQVAVRMKPSGDVVCDVCGGATNELEFL